MNNKRKSVFSDIYYRPYRTKYTKLFDDAKDDESFVQRLGLIKKLPIHHGCVNTIAWNDTGRYILSGSDDQRLIITNGHNYKVEANYLTSHHANIFSAKFLPCSGDKQIISCSGDGVVLHTDLNRPTDTLFNKFNCHGDTTTYEVITIPDDPNTFMSCGEDGTVRWFDLRTKSSCNKPCCKEDIIISCQRAVTALSVSPNSPHHLAIGCADSTVRIYDRRYLTQGEEILATPICNFVSPHFDQERHYRITSLSYSPDGQDMLENKSTELRKPEKKVSPWDKIRAVTHKRERFSPPPVRRLRLRGDWSDTGPDARPERETSTTVGIGQARPQLASTIMQHMTNVLSHMLNEPMTRQEEGGASGEEGGDSPNRNAAEIAENNDEDVADQDSRPEQSLMAHMAQSANQHALSNLRSLHAGFIEQQASDPFPFRPADQGTSNSINFDDSATAASSSVQYDAQGSNEGGDGDFKEETVTSEPAVTHKTDRYQAEMKMKYTGHRNARTMIKEACFWGNDYVMSGSDCGHVFIWNRHTSDLKMLLQADQHVVNCLQPHPTLPVLATSGIDHDVKLWAPVLEECGFDDKQAEDLISRNAIMLEETRDTITVPAAFMIRMLDCLNQIFQRRGARIRARRQEGAEDT